MVKHKRGLPGAMLYVVHLDRIVRECERLLAEGPDPDLERLLAEARPAHDELSAAALDMRSADAARKLAMQRLEKAYHSSKDRFFKVRAGLYSKYGLRQCPELAGFGIKGVTRVKRRPPRDTGASDTAG